MPWLICYDVADRKRLQRVHHRMKQHAMPLEYSVFWLDGSPNDRNACLEEIVPILRREEDDLRSYAMPGRGFRLRLGLPALPEGIVWTALPGAWWCDSFETALMAEDQAETRSSLNTTERDKD